MVEENKPKVSKTLSAEAPRRSLKRKVAVARFTNETRYSGSGFFLGSEYKEKVAKQAMDILSARLAATDKFILLERSDIEKIEQELKRGDISNLNITADYLIIGSVVEHGRKEVGEVGVLSRTRKQVVNAKVNIRLVDVMTGQIIYSEEGEGEAFLEHGSVLGMGGRASYDSSLDDKAISAAISKLVNNVVENLLDKPWRSYILTMEGGQYIIAGGRSQGISEGDVFGVYRRGKKVKNPQTNMLIELPGQYIGKLQVVAMTGTTPNDEISFCYSAGGNIPMNNFAELYVQEAERGK